MLADPNQLCHHQFYQVTACTLEFWQPQPMLLQIVVPLLFSIIQGILVVNCILLALSANSQANESYYSLDRASPSEFVIPLAKYNKALYTQVSLGMRFRMLFETEDSGVRRYMGTITGIGDLDPIRWKNSHWRNLQVCYSSFFFSLQWYLFNSATSSKSQLWCYTYFR